MPQPIIIIPARLAATRLPNKPLAMIGDAPMITHCWRRACEADIGPVWVAAGDAAIVDAIQQVGGQALLTDPNHPSGSDRIWEALCRIDPDGSYQTIVNVQGDLPTLDAAAIRIAAEPLAAHASVDIATLAAPIEKPEDGENPNIVKIACHFDMAVAAGQAPFARAHYFSRQAIPAGDGPLYHHIGLYAYRRQALERFISLPPSGLEKREKLEQLRALEAGMQIGVSLVDTVPLGVDTPQDLEMARQMLAGR